jgi:hypothetical protein
LYRFNLVLKYYKKTIQGNYTTFATILEVMQASQLFKNFKNMWPTECVTSGRRLIDRNQIAEIAFWTITSSEQ